MRRRKHLAFGYDGVLVQTAAGSSVGRLVTGVCRFHNLLLVNVVRSDRGTAELRKRFPAGLGDEEFLLRATMPADQVDAMLAAGPARRHYNPDLKPVLDLLAGLRKRPGVSGVVVNKPGFRLELRAGHPRGAGDD